MPRAIDPAEQAQAMSPQGDALVYALQITHPQLVDDVRIVADNAEHTIDGELYLPLAFRAQFPQDKEGEKPEARIEIDYVGRELMTWVEASNGGRGAKMRVMQVMRAQPSSRIRWEVALQVGQAQITQNRLSVALVSERTYGRPAVKIRHDPATSPGLF